MYCGIIDVNAPDKESGWTPLHRALYYGYFALMPALLACGCSLAAKDWKGRTPIDIVSHIMRCMLEASRRTRASRPAARVAPAASSGRTLAWG